MSAPSRALSTIEGSIEASGEISCGGRRELLTSAAFRPAEMWAGFSSVVLLLRQARPNKSPVNVACCVRMSRQTEGGRGVAHGEADSNVGFKVAWCERRSVRTKVGALFWKASDCA